jgi:hypothetical protein
VAQYQHRLLSAEHAGEIIHPADPVVPSCPFYMRTIFVASNIKHLIVEQMHQTIFDVDTAPRPGSIHLL